MAATPTHTEPLAGDELSPLEREDELQESRCPDCGTPARSTESEDWCIVCAQPVGTTHPTGKPEEKRLRIETRFWEKVEIREQDQCWEWQAGINSAGYGAFCVDAKMEPAHRVAVALDRGETNPRRLPDDEVMHRCHNKTCVNPRHLQIGTYHDNRVDSLIVDDIPLKLEPREVREIRELLSETGRTYTSIAGQYDVSRETISRIDDGEQYAWVE